MSSTKTPEERQRPLDEAHKRAMLCAAKLVSRTVETRDLQVRNPLTAMSRRMFEVVFGIRKQAKDLQQNFGIVYEVILEAERDSKLDVAAQEMLGKISIQEPVELSLPDQGPSVTNTTYFLHPSMSGLQIDRLSEEQLPNVHYILHDITQIPAS